MKDQVALGNAKAALLAFKKTKTLGPPEDAVRIEFDPWTGRFLLNSSVLPMSVGRDLYEFLKEFYE